MTDNSQLTFYRSNPHLPECFAKRRQLYSKASWVILCGETCLRTLDMRCRKKFLDLEFVSNILMTQDVQRLWCSRPTELRNVGHCDGRSILSVLKLMYIDSTMAATSTRGLLTVVEGLDRSGKSSQCQLLRDNLNKAGRHVKYVKFPGLFIQ